jgi:hypothetical protein
MKTIKFTKDIEVSFWSAGFNESDSRQFRRGQYLQVETIEVVDKFHSNLVFDNGDVAVEVPGSSYVTIS